MIEILAMGSYVGLKEMMDVKVVLNHKALGMS